MKPNNRHTKCSANCSAVPLAQNRTIAPRPLNYEKPRFAICRAFRMRTTTVLSNQEVQSSLSHLARKLARLRASDAPPRAITRQRRRARRPGWVQDAVVRVLADHGAANANHGGPRGCRGAAWRAGFARLSELGSRVRRSSFRAALRSSGARSIRPGAPIEPDRFWRRPIRAPPKPPGSRRSIQSNDAERMASANWLADWWLRRGCHSAASYQGKPRCSYG